MRSGGPARRKKIQEVGETQGSQLVPSWDFLSAVHLLKVDGCQIFDRAPRVKFRKNET
jgi:hypothetical protein